MNLPSDFSQITEWMIVGPMGPQVSYEEKLPLIAVDGGAKFAPSADIWVGDADSHRDVVDSQHVYRFPVQKDSSDLALALKLFKDHHRYKLHLWGFLGGRRDHELFNLGEAGRFLESHPESQIYLYDSDGHVRFHFLAEGHWKFERKGLFSLGTLKKTQVTLTGDCEFPVETPGVLLPLSSQGLSNRGFGEIKLTTEGPVFLYFAEEP